MQPSTAVESLILHQDNAPQYYARSTIIDIDFTKGFERLSHAPYTPDLAPCDFEIFPRLKKELRGTRRLSREHLITRMNAVVKSPKSDWYHKTFQYLVRRHRKTVENDGCYFEKLWHLCTASDVNVVDTFLPAPLGGQYVC